MSEKGIEITESTAIALAAAVRWLRGREIPVTVGEPLTALRAISRPHKLGDNLVFKIEFWTYPRSPESKAEVTVILKRWGDQWEEKELSFVCPRMGYPESHPARVFLTENYKLQPIRGTNRLY